MARTRKFTDHEIVSALRETKGMVFLAAQKIGCNPDTIYERAKRSKAITAALRMERGRAVDAAELRLQAAVRNGEPWAIRMTLQCLGRSRGYLDNGALYEFQKEITELREQLAEYAKRRYSEA
jgi:hypothetical protein